MNIAKKNIVLLLITIAVYFNTFWNGFSFDDNFIENNAIKGKGFSAIKEIFTSHYWQEKENTFGYRPLARIVYYIEFQITDTNPGISHLINVLLYALTILLLFKILQKLFPNNVKWAWWASILFALHPIHTEVVASLKNREELFVLWFGLLSIWMILKYIDQSKIHFLIFSILFLWLSLLSKENGAVFSLLIPITFLIYINFNIKIIKTKPMLWVYFSIIIISSWILYKLPAWILTPEDKILFPFENPLYENNTRLSRILLSIESLGFYFWKLIFPFPLLYYYGYNMLNIPQNITFFSILFMLLSFISILLLIKKSVRNNLIIWSLLWFWISLLPFSNYFIPINGIVAERLVYTASLGFIVMLTYFIFKLKKIGQNILIGLSFIFFVLTIYRNHQWKSVDRLLRADMPYLENSAKAHTSFATMLMNNLNKQMQNNYTINYGTVDSIIYHYKKAIDIYPRYYAAMNNLGLVYFHLIKDDSLANYWFNEAIKIKPNYSEAMYNLSKVKLRQNDTIKSIYFLKKSLHFDSSNIYILNDIVNIYLYLHQKDSAAFLNHKIWLIDSTSDIPYINFGNFALLEKDTLMAVKQWEIAICKNPNNLPLLYGLSRYFRQNKNEAKAVYYENLLYQQQSKHKKITNL